MSANVHQLAPRRIQASPVLTTARITGATPNGVLLDLPGHPHAHVAISCLLEPQTGDTVLLSCDTANNEHYVLAILERPDTSHGALTLPGNTRIHLAPDQFELQTGKVALNATRQLDLNSAQVNLTAASSTVNVKHWQGWFDTVEAGAVNITLVAKTLSSRLGRLIQRAAESFRKTEGLDELQAGRSRTHIDGHQQTRAGHITTVAEGSVKIDGKKIDLG